MTHDKLRLEYDKAMGSMGTRFAFRALAISSYRDIFSPTIMHVPTKTSNSILTPDVALRQQSFRNFINKDIQRKEDDLKDFQLIDLRIHLSMLLDITASLYRVRAQLRAELRALVDRCAADTRWLGANPQQRNMELMLSKVPHLDKAHTWFLCTPIEWKEKHAAYKYPELIDATRYDLVSVKSLLILCAEDREFLIWHVDEMRKIVGILRDDLARLG